MILTLIILVIIAVGVMLGILAFVRKRKAIQKQWKAAFRHIVALIMGWIAFGTLSGLLVLLDLMERDKLSITDFGNGVLTPLIIFISGLVLLILPLATTE
jgi:uncharacterized membrane protein